MEIRVTAIKDQARAGIVSTQYLNDTAVPQGGGLRAFKASHRGKTKWLPIAAAWAEVRAAGMIFGRS
jgi:hypothetical protein